MVYLDPKVVEEARELGLNISKVCENALKEAIRRLKGENPKTNPNILNSHMPEGSSSVKKDPWWAGRDFDSRTCHWEPLWPPLTLPLPFNIPKSPII